MQGNWTCPGTAPSETPTGYDVHYTSAPKTGAGAVANVVDASGNDASAAWVAHSRGTEASHPTASQTIGSLDGAGTTYRVRVRAKYADGDGPWVFGSGMPATLPAPTDLTVNPGGGGLDLHVSWTAPTATDTVTGYDVHYTSAASGTVADDADASGSDASAAWVAVARTEASPPATSQTIGSLTSGTAYRVRVRAKYGDDNGPWVFGSRTASAAPSLTDLQVENGDRLLVLSWTAPTAGTVLVYNMHYTSSATVSRSAERGTDPATAWVSAIGTSSATSYTLTGLTNGVPLPGAGDHGDGRRQAVVAGGAPGCTARARRPRRSSTSRRPVPPLTRAPPSARL